MTVRQLGEIAPRLWIALTADPYLPVPPRHYGGIERVVAFLVAGLVEYGHRVTLWAAPGSDMPYQDERCRLTFESTTALDGLLGEFWTGVQAGTFSPRDYILGSLTLEKSAQAYVDIA